MKQGTMCLTLASGVLLCGLLVSPVVVAEVYRWTDANGVTHFSQTPPPEGQPAEIADVPDVAPVDAANPDAGVDSDGMQSEFAETAQTPTEDTMSPADLKRQELAEQRARRRAEQAALETSCGQAQTRLAQIEPARRVFYTNDQGETVRMDDEQRVAEVEQLKDFITANCP